MESTVSAAMTGPIAKPPTSIETPRPRLPPMFSGSLTMTIRLIAGIAIPAPTPMTKRPSKNSGSEDPKAMINAPAAFAAMPTVISLRACPLSAYGAIVSWAINEVKKPTAIIMLSPVSWIPYSARQSSSMVNMTPYPEANTPIAI